MPTSPFDDLSEAYDAMIDWPRRLANETPFFKKIFDQIKAGRVLDVACGVGRHAALFHDWRLEVEAADLSPAMIQLGQSRHPASSTLSWFVRGFDQPCSRPGTFDAAICIGNSLALTPDRPVMAKTIHQMHQAIRPGGVVILHLLNLWRLPEGPCQWQKCIRTRLHGTDCLIQKGVHRAGERGFVNLLVTQLEQTPPIFRSDCVPFLGLTEAELVAACQDAGAKHVQAFGSWQQTPYQPSQSQDLIILSTRR